MGGLEFNKIFAAILIAGITAMLAGFIAEQLTYTHELEENAYAIEGVEAADVGSGGPQLPDPILALLGEADIARGQKLSKACAACHTFEKGGANGVGPNQYDIVGREKQSVPGFAYSGALNENGGNVWTYAELNKFLWKPKEYAPGTKMNYIGMKKPEDRAALIAWLRTMSDNPQPLPGAADIAAEQAELAPPESEADDADAVDGEELEEAVETLKEGEPGEVSSELDGGELEEAAEDVQEAVNEAEGVTEEEVNNPASDSGY
jgi:cytochrome c